MTGNDNNGEMGTECSFSLDLMTKSNGHRGRPPKSEGPKINTENVLPELSSEKSKNYLHISEGLDILINRSAFKIHIFSDEKLNNNVDIDLSNSMEFMPYVISIKKIKPGVIRYTYKPLNEETIAHLAKTKNNLDINFNDNPNIEKLKELDGKFSYIIDNPYLTLLALSTDCRNYIGGALRINPNAYIFNTNKTETFSKIKLKNILKYDKVLQNSRGLVTLLAEYIRFK